MNEEYIKATENWIAQAKIRLQQSIENREYLEKKIKLEYQELHLINEDIKFSKEWIEKTEFELEIYKKNNL